MFWEKLDFKEKYMRKKNEDISKKNVWFANIKYSVQKTR